MPFETLVLYVITAFVVVLIPGPLSLFMVANSVRYGILKSCPAFLGGTVASSMYLIISASGVGVLIIASPRLFLTLKILGAVYLVGLGIATIRAAAKKPQADKEGLLDGGESVIFVHTGGVAALFACRENFFVFSTKSNTRIKA